MNKYVYFFLISVLLMLFSCEVRFDPNVRIAVNGTVVNDEGAPIEAAEVSVYTRRSTGNVFAPGPSSSNEFLLGRNYSSQNGNFEVVSIFDRDEDFSIVVLKDEDFSHYEYATNTVENVPDNLSFNLETVELKRVGNVNYTITRESGSDNSLQFSFKYVIPFCLEFYNLDGLDPNQSFCFEEQFLNRTSSNNNPDFEGNFRTPYGTQVEFTYTLNEQESITEIFTLNQENYEFTFSY
nr:hypothetical protein [uncultured Psychroserpens sp.]